MQQG
jgi:hypothetical protein